MPTKTITLRVPSNIPKKKIEEFIKKLELEEKYKKTEEFKLFVKDEDWRMKIYKIAEFVENYLKKKYPDEKFEIVLDYDGIDDRAVIRVVFERGDVKDVNARIKRVHDMIDDVRLKCHEKFFDLMFHVLVTHDWKGVVNV
jgi:hypothetical protein